MNSLERAPVNDKISYARQLAHADLLPQEYKNAPANVLWAVEYGSMLGLSPMAAITGIHVIKGKPSASAGLISGLVRSAGHRIRVSIDRERMVATCTIVRRDDPDFEYRSDWSLDRAQRARLCSLKDGMPTGTDGWGKYPEAMLKHRAVTECARDACEDVLFGLHYTPEELGADVDESGTPVTVPSETAPAPVAQSSTPAPAMTAPEAPALPEPPDQSAPVLDEESQKAQGYLAKALEDSDPDSRLDKLRKLRKWAVARPVQHTVLTEIDQQIQTAEQGNTPAEAEQPELTSSTEADGDLVIDEVDYKQAADLVESKEDYDDLVRGTEECGSAHLDVLARAFELKWGADSPKVTWVRNLAEQTREEERAAAAAA